MPLNAPRTRVMLALDLPDRETAFRVMDRCAAHVDSVKINHPLIMAEGIGIIPELKRLWGLPVVADVKVADVPVTNNRIGRLLRDAGADGVLAHGFIGSDALLELVDILQDQTSVFVVTELTHPGGLEFTRQHSEDFARLAVLVGAAGIQAPGTRPEQIKVLRDIVGPDSVVISCGIGAQGGSLRDAILAGADFGIVGRAIYEAEDPGLAAQLLAGHAAP